MKPSVVIFGAGPSAAHINKACEYFDIVPEVYSLTKNVSPPGAFWFYKPFESNAPLHQIYNVGFGERSIYMEKQWGIEHAFSPSSFPMQPEIKYGYNPRLVWDNLWGKTKVLECERLTSADIIQASIRKDLVFVTFPVEETLASRKEFIVSYKVLVESVRHTEMNTVIYDGVTKDVTRISTLFGTRYTEFRPKCSLSFRSKQNLVKVRDLHPDVPAISKEEQLGDNIRFIGRFASFRRKELSHEAFAIACDMLRSLVGDPDEQ